MVSLLYAGPKSSLLLSLPKYLAQLSLKQSTLELGRMRNMPLSNVSSPPSILAMLPLSSGMIFLSTMAGGFRQKMSAECLDLANSRKMVRPKVRLFLAVKTKMKERSNSSLLANRAEKLLLPSPILKTISIDSMSLLTDFLSLSVSILPPSGKGVNIESALKKGSSGFTSSLIGLLSSLKLTKLTTGLLLLGESGAMFLEFSSCFFSFSLRVSISLSASSLSLVNSSTSYYFNTSIVLQQLSSSSSFVGILDLEAVDLSQAFSLQTSSLRHLQDLVRSSIWVFILMTSLLQTGEVARLTVGEGCYNLAIFALSVAASASAVSLLDLVCKRSAFSLNCSSFSVFISSFCSIFLLSASTVASIFFSHSSLYSSRSLLIVWSWFYVSSLILAMSTAI